jgi:hypothetical protein
MPKQKKSINGTAPRNPSKRTMAVWYALVGHAIVRFGALERVTLSWAVALGLEHQKMLALHKNDMKKFAPALRNEVKKFERRLTPATYARALSSIDAAEALIPPRNDVAHGWLQLHDGALKFFLAKRVSGGKLVFATRKRAWLRGLIAKTDSVLTELIRAMDDVGGQLGIRAEAD